MRSAAEAALHKEGGDDKGDERPDELQGLSDFRSIQFHLFLTELMVNKLVTQIINCHTDSTDFTEMENVTQISQMTQII